MTEEKQNQESSSKGCFIMAMVMIGLVIAVIVITILVYSNIGSGGIKRATMSDIDGHWNSTITTCEYVFIPKHNINDLTFAITICDDNRQELQTIYKTVGNVRKGQQYSVSFSVLEFQSFSTVWNASYTKISVSRGDITVF